VGRVREHNEDSLLVKSPLFAIADGMGGHAAGEVASELAIRTLDDAQIDEVDHEALRRAVIAANRAVIQGAARGLGRPGMGTTLTAAVLEDDELLIAQVGDSRAYLLHDRHLQQVTRDHSLVEELVAGGQITAAEARVHPNRSVITRALGSDGAMQPDMYELKTHSGDRLLLCSDGLSALLTSETLREVLLHNPDPQQAADALVEAANEAGGFDNITVIVVDMEQVTARSDARRARRFIWGIVGFLLAFALLVAAAAGGVYAYARNAAFLIDEGGYVVLYRGLPGSVLGMELKWREQETAIKVSSLSPTTAQELGDGLQTESLDEAQRLIKSYGEQQNAR
jgi:protein phosphatase